MKRKAQEATSTSHKMQKSALVEEQKFQCPDCPVCAAACMLIAACLWRASVFVVGPCAVLAFVVCAWSLLGSLLCVVLAPLARRSASTDRFCFVFRPSSLGGTD